MKNAAYISVGSNTVMLSSGILTALELVDVIPGLVAAFVFASVGFGITPFTHGKVTEDYEFIWKQREVKLKSAYEIICSKRSKGYTCVFSMVSPLTQGMWRQKRMQSIV
jgi:hypothetical protein